MAILMDEPTAALGTKQSDVVCATIKEVAARGLGVFVISHDIPRMLEVADTAGDPAPGPGRPRSGRPAS